MCGTKILKYFLLDFCRFFGIDKDNYLAALARNAFPMATGFLLLLLPPPPPPLLLLGLLFCPCEFETMALAVRWRLRTLTRCRKKKIKIRGNVNKWKKGLNACVYIWEEIAQYNCGRSLSPPPPFPPFRMACAQRKEGKRRVVKTRDFFSFWGKWGQCTARRFSFLFLSTYFYGKDKHVFRAREREVETIFHMIRRGQNCYFKYGYYAGKTR